MLSTYLFFGMPFTEKYKLHCWKNLEDFTKFEVSQHINVLLVPLLYIFQDKKDLKNKNEKLMVVVIKIPSWRFT